LQTFRAYCRKRHETLDACLAFYADYGHRQRRWKTYIKTQKSEQRLYERLQGIHKEGDKRTLVLAYGSWGTTDGASCIKKGNPPTIGVGLMRKLAKRFVVSLTPEHHTSKTCCKCLGPCGPLKKVKEEMKAKFFEDPKNEGKRFHGVRGLRICQDVGCKLRLNRDRNAATNIGTNFRRLFRGESCIHKLTVEEREFLRLDVGCGPCDEN
jgi:hypothetical protein